MANERDLSERMTLAEAQELLGLPDVFHRMHLPSGETVLGSGQAMDEMKEMYKDAERYRWLCDGNGYFLEEEWLCGQANEKPAADEAIDAERDAKGG